MDRRGFLKGLLLAWPAWRLHPLVDLVDRIEPLTLSAKRPGQELVVIFIGRFGLITWRRFQRLRRAYPILVKCRNIIMEVNSDDGFVVLSGNDDLPPILSQCRNAECVMIIADGRGPAEAVLAERIAMLLSAAEGYTILFTPLTARNFQEESFDLIVETAAARSDQTADLLLTFYNRYLGCGDLGNVMCLHKNLRDFEEKGLWRWQGAVFYESMAHIPYDFKNLSEGLLPFISRPDHGRKMEVFCVVAEIRQDQAGALDLISSVFSEIEKFLDGQIWFLAASSLPRSEMRLTVLRLVERLSPAGPSLRL